MRVALAMNWGYKAFLSPLPPWFAYCDCSLFLWWSWHGLIDMLLLMEISSDGMLCAAPDENYGVVRSDQHFEVTGLFPCGWLAIVLGDFIKLPIVCWAFSLLWPFSFDTCGRPHFPPETDLAAGGVPVCWLLLLQPEDETCELLILTMVLFVSSGILRTCDLQFSLLMVLLALSCCGSLLGASSFDTCGRPHFPPETDLAAGGVSVCWVAATST
ncbi:hypothetical protein Nepgr_009372 [Nepenthes gracilis]|uniref:Uncharacterized protein n=1 Tax=Nepenthes gracilis TaxID=150966 RepID=A0AAD3SB93_NEPGR|nr:hypothetical protein Nepgr_009372 [Nepenthes gracilis]